MRLADRLDQVGGHLQLAAAIEIARLPIGGQHHDDDAFELMAGARDLQ